MVRESGTLTSLVRKRIQLEYRHPLFHRLTDEHGSILFTSSKATLDISLNVVLPHYPSLFSQIHAYKSVCICCSDIYLLHAM
jgi:hypothetical protein